MLIIVREIDNVVRRRALLFMMVRRELAARHAGAVLGRAWIYVQPVLMLAAYYFLFDIVLGVRLGSAHSDLGVGAHLVAGMLPWMAFCDAASRSTTCLIDAGGLLQKNPLPPVLFPVKAVTASAITFAPLILVLFLIYAPYHRFSASMVAFPLVLASLYCLCLLIGYVLAVLVAAMRDVQQIVGFLIGVGVFLTPILYSYEMFPHGFRWALWLNPMTPIVVSFQSLLLHGSLPPAWMAISVFSWIVVAGVMVEVLMRRSTDYLVDWL